MDRARESEIRRDLEKKMVFLVGPRQTGKTWLASRIGESYPKSVYLNHDSGADRRIIERGAWIPDADLVILDEIHKMRGWKNHLKGIWDTRPTGQRFLITGSARLDTIRQTGDSMAGRFFRHRLLPFTPAELVRLGESPSVDRLLERGGFPEPFLAEDSVEAGRWRTLYADGLIQEDIVDFERIANLRAMRLVLTMLRERVGSPVSFSSIARDIGISPNTAAKYTAILESLFIVFLVTPHSRNIARSLLKEPKIYFFDTGFVKGDAGAVFENLVALCLLKDVWARADLDGEECELRYLRTKDGEEVDFCVIRNGEPELFIEVKLSDDAPGRTLRKFRERYGVRSIHLVKDLKNERTESGIEVRRAADWLAALRE